MSPDLPPRQVAATLRLSIAAFEAGAVILALNVQSVQALWFFTSDLVFVLLFPQLIAALFDRKANLVGSCAAFTVSLVLRLGGGEPLFDVPPLLPYPDVFPFRIAAAVAGLILLPMVSRLTAPWNMPRPLGAVTSGERVPQAAS